MSRSAAVGDPKKRLELAALKAAIGQMREQYAFSERRARGVAMKAASGYGDRGGILGQNEFSQVNKERGKRKPYRRINFWGKTKILSMKTPALVIYPLNFR